MHFSAAYLIHRFFYRFWLFIFHWYIGSFLVISQQVFKILENFDRSLALRITLKNLFRPLYQDRTPVGFILGFIFRMLRVVIAAVIYFVVISVGIIVYLVWILIPVYIIIKGFFYE